jgi:hypothetical protein
MNSPTPVLSLPKANESRFILFTHSIANIKWRKLKLPHFFTFPFNIHIKESFEDTCLVNLCSGCLLYFVNHFWTNIAQASYFWRYLDWILDVEFFVLYCFQANGCFAITTSILIQHLYFL